MRVFSALVLSLLSVLLLAAPTQAKYWVSGFKGAASGYVVEREGKALVPSALMGLREGDKISIKQPDGELTLLDEGKPGITVTTKNSPFTIPAAKPPTMFDNALQNFWNMVNARESSSITAATRGTLKPRRTGFLATNGDANLLPLPVNELFIPWHGTIGGPVDLALEQNGKTIACLEKAAPDQLRLTGLSLTPGDYVIKITPAGSKAKAATRKFSVVEKSRLPDSLQKIHKMELPVAARTRYLIIRMTSSRYKKWRFHAYQLARKNQFSQAVKLLEAGVPDGSNKR